MSNPSAIAAVGASAGGVEALRTMFGAAQPGSGLCYVVLLHLAPHRESTLTEIIARDSPLPVETAADGRKLEADHVYVVPAGVVPTVAGGRITLLQDNGPDRETRSINVLFSSLALDAKERSIAVVLSGFGSDGTLGVKTIKEQGGLTVAQGSNGTAPGHPGMPDSAIASGLVDLVLPAELIPGKLAEYVHSFDQLATLTANPGERAEAEEARIGAARLSICEILRRASGHDFAGYKERTFLRRVQRRMQVLRSASVEAYVERLRADHDEALALMRDLLISVTGFFRDGDAFAELSRQVIPRLFEGKGAADSVRVWVPAAATGEEAYTLAILLREHASRIAAPPRLQVFATDIDEAALQVARVGRYPVAQTAQISPERLARYFVKENASLLVTREIRESCIFSSHSLIRDPPFSRLDLISCRNLLIYLDSTAQRDLFPTFHYALRPRGYLFLGSAESANQFVDLFRPVDKHHRIYQRRDHATPRVRLPLRLPLVEARASVQPGGPAAVLAAVRKAAETAVLEQFAPSHVVVNSEGEVIHFSAHTGNYLEPALGQPTRNLLALARRGLRLELRAALQDCLRTRRPTSRSDIDPDTIGLPGRVSLTVEVLPETDPAEPLFLVVFIDVGPTATAAIPAQAGEPMQFAVHQAEMRDTRERLQTLIEEHQTAAEELRVSNEELVSVNEELQSANEELETAKEEQQSVNEELQMVNVELQSKVEELARANADLKNLFEATRVATVMLDRDLSIRSFTPAIAGLFNLLPSDCGRPLTDIATALDTNQLLHDARNVLAGGKPVERRVSLRAGRTHYLLRVLPYHTAEQTVDGVLVAFVDVTQLVEAVDAHEHQRTLVMELNHRVRNMLQVVIGLTRQTLREGQTPAEFGVTLTGRMRSLSQAYQLISEVEWGDVDLNDLVQQQLGPHLPQPARGSAKGPGVTLRPAGAVAMGLVLHELATNAMKYGALSGDDGHVAVSWIIKQVAAGRAVVLRWQERGGPPMVAPKRKGFGSELIRRQVKHTLRGEIDSSYNDEGFVAIITLPLDIEPCIVSAA
jgi:two-component system CheB/CheR fusion protein